VSAPIWLPIPRDAADALARRSLQWLEPLAGNEAFAAWVELATRTQSVFVAAADKPQRLAARLIGRRTTAERREREEREARRHRSGESRTRPAGERFPAASKAIPVFSAEATPVSVFRSVPVLLNCFTCPLPTPAKLSPAVVASWAWIVV